MKKILTLSGFLFVLFFANQLMAQTIPAKPLNQSTLQPKDAPNLNTIRQHFYQRYNKYYKNDKEKHLGNGEGKLDNDGILTQFKRWEYLMMSRTFPTGNLPDPGIQAREFENYKATHPQFYNNANTLAPSAGWTPIGPAVVPSGGGGAGRINVIHFDPNNSNIIYLGAAGGGVWKTTDGGSTWAALGDNFPVTSIADIAIDPTNTNIVYAATGDGYGYEATWQQDSDFWGGVYASGVMKSTDGGATWNTTGLNFQQADNEIIQRMIINPDNPSILLAATRGGIYRTADGGNNWTLVNTNHCYDLEWNTANSNIVYAGGSTNIYSSSDAGATWSVLKSGIGLGSRMSIEVTAANSLVIYALTTDNVGTDKLYKSSDGGTTWVAKVTPPAGFYHYYDLVLKCSEVNENYLLAGGQLITKSTNGGQSWQSVSSSGIHVDNHALQFLPGSTQTIFSGNDGGFFKNTTFGSSGWTDLSTGLRVAQIYRLSSSVTNPDIIISGWQDNGCNKYNGTTYSNIFGADGMETIIDYTNANVMYESSQYGSVSKSTNGGNSWSGLPAPGGAWITPYVMDPVDHNKIYYFGSSSLYRSTNGGSNFTAIGTNFVTSPDMATYIMVAPSNTNVIYVTQLGKIRKTTTGGAPWTDVTAGIPTGSSGINYGAVSNTDPNNVWVCMSGYAAGGKVYHSIDGGANWTNISGTLPNVPVNTIVYEYNSPDRVYIGTDLGVFYRDNSMSDWAPYMTGLPNVMVHELEINYTSNKLIAATYGRGLWQNDLATSQQSSISTSVVGTSFCPGQSLSVSYTAVGTFNAGNIFTAQLSDASGSFTSAINIGSVTSTTSGSISAVIPSSTASGSAYRIRVVSSDPVVTGTDNGSNLTITCPSPTGLASSNVTATTADISWATVPCAVSYQVRYKASTASSWTKVKASGTTFTLTGLIPSTKYKWSVRTKCASGPNVYSDYAPNKTFTTAASKISVADGAVNASPQLYPNPFHTSATLQFSLGDRSNVTVKLYDLSGKMVEGIFNGVMDEGAHQLNIDRSTLPSGVYFLKLVSGDNSSTMKMVVE